jgi:hypothetical protein
MARINGYSGAPSQLTIDRNILAKEKEMVLSLLKAAKWNRSGATIDDWLIKADVKALEIQTLKTKCPDKIYDFVDESLESGCKVGKGIGLMRITGTANLESCPVFVVRDNRNEQPLQGDFVYCDFRPIEFNRVTGIPAPCGDGCRRLPYRTRFKLISCSEPPETGFLPFDLGFDLNGQS